MLKNKFILFSIISTIIVVLDQITKILVLDKMPLYHSIAIIDGFFNLTHIHNTGGAFGLLADQHPILRAVIFLGISILSLFIILYYYAKTPPQFPMLRMGLSLIFGGAVGNIADRIRMGEVVDFLDFYIGNYHWPAFNVADSAVSVGVVILIYYMLIKKVI